jgi:hypothetical protein
VCDAWNSFRIHVGLGNCLTSPCKTVWVVWILAWGTNRNGWGIRHAVGKIACLGIYGLPNVVSPWISAERCTMLVRLPTNSVFALQFLTCFSRL